MLQLPKVLLRGIVLLSSVALFAQTTSTAVLLGTGSVYVNGEQVSNSLAVSPGDVIQTKENGAAHITAPGSSLAIDSNSIVRLRPEGFALDRGTVSVATAKGTSVFARDFKITPATDKWTEFYVTRTNGSIGIIARKSDVTVNCGATSSSSTTVKEGQQISRDDAGNCGLAGLASQGGAAPAAVGPVITPTMEKIGGVVLGGVIACWAALCHTDNPVSPYKP